MWQLILDGVVVGQVRERDVDQPFFICDFTPTPEFERFAPLFTEELRLLDADMMDAWMEHYETHIDTLKPRLVSAGDVIDDLLLHIKGDEAWFRY